MPFDAQKGIFGTGRALSSSLTPPSTEFSVKIKQENDGNLATDGRLIASIHKAAFPTNLKEVIATKPWDLLFVDECHHLSAYGDDDAKKKVKQYALVDELVKKLPDGGRLILARALSCR